MNKAYGPFALHSQSWEANELHEALQVAAIGLAHLERGESALIHDATISLFISPEDQERSWHVSVFYEHLAECAICDTNE